MKGRNSEDAESQSISSPFYLIECPTLSDRVEEKGGKAKEQTSGTQTHSGNNSNTNRHIPRSLSLPEREGSLFCLVFFCFVCLLGFECVVSYLLPAAKLVAASPSICFLFLSLLA